MYLQQQNHHHNHRSHDRAVQRSSHGTKHDACSPERAYNTRASLEQDPSLVSFHVEHSDAPRNVPRGMFDSALEACAVAPCLYITD